MTTTTDYRTTVRVNASADAVFDAVTTAEALAAWWSPVTGSGWSTKTSAPDPAAK